MSVMHFSAKVTGHESPEDDDQPTGSEPSAGTEKPVHARPETTKIDPFDLPTEWR